MRQTHAVDIGSEGGSHVPPKKTAEIFWVQMSQGGCIFQRNGFGVMGLDVLNHRFEAMQIFLTLGFPRGWLFHLYMKVFERKKLSY